MLSLLAAWYVFIGIFWFYLILHEQFQTGVLAVEWQDGTFRFARMVLLQLVLCLTLWPYSLYCFARAGRLRDLFE